MGNGFSMMVRERPWVATGAVVLACAIGLGAASSASSQTIKEPVKFQRTVGELVIRTKGAPSVMMQTSLSATLNRALGNDAILSLKPFHTDEKFQLIRLKRDQDLDKAIAALKSHPSIDIAEPNYIYHALDLVDGIPNDPDFSKTWGMKNNGQKDPAGQTGVAGADINVVPLWKEGYRGSRNILVAVIDTGVEWTHPDLVDNLYTNPGESGEKATNGVDDDGNGFIDDLHGWNFNANTRDSNDDNAHGSHTAGTIGATGNNGVGVAGVNWEVSILPVKFLSGDGSGTLAAAVESINYARLMKANIMSNSWGGGPFTESLKVAIEAARDAGILFVAAAGNEGNNNDQVPTYPASYEISNIVAVAATDNKDNLASFSNFGNRRVHVAAPGVKVHSTVNLGKYEAYSGTSMACPHVSGIAALIMSANPNLSIDEIKERLIKTSDPVPALKRKVMAKGRVNATNAFYNIVPPTTEPDEKLWIDVPMAIESEHPYKEKVNLTFKVEQPGAKFIRVFFEKVQVETRYDFVMIETAAGAVVDQLTGTMDNYTTEYVQGDSLIIRLKSDNSVNGYGFKVTKIQYIPEPPAQQ